MAATDKALFDRRCKVTIANPVADPTNFAGSTTFDVTEIDGGTTGDVDSPAMRCAFKIEKSVKKEPNTGEVTVTNLSSSSRGALQKVGVKVLLEAGYKGTGVTRIFSGDVRTVDHVRDGASWHTVLKLGDGERAWRFARVNESFAPGTKASDVLKRLAGSLGLETGNLDSERLSKVTAVLDQGFAACGSASRSLDLLVKSLGLEWSVQDGALQVLDPYEAIGAAPDQIPEVSPTSGLVGSPEMGSAPKKGKPALVKFKSLLIPIKPGSKVRLKSDRYDGEVRAQKVSYSGDTHGGDWYVEVDGVLLK